jgi:hypothetical protein
MQLLLTIITIIQVFIHLRAELSSQWPITESARIQTTAIRQHRTKQTTKQIKMDNNNNNNNNNSVIIVLK